MPDLRSHALQLLTRRDYSRAELKTRLAGEAESEAALEALLDDLQAARFLSDHRYASQRVAARGTRYGNARLRQELARKGVSDEDITAALPEAGDEAVRCRDVWVRKFGSLPTSAQERAKHIRFLQYRGFSGEAIRRTLSGAEE